MSAGGGPPSGLCESCRHQQLVRTTRGSVFSLCRRSRDQPEQFPRYPRLPVTRCSGYEPGERDSTAKSDPTAERDRTPTEGEADSGR